MSIARILRLHMWCAGVLALVSSAVFSAETGVTEDRILLGQSAAFSGPAAQLGIQLNLGAKVYFDHVNRSGGVYGRRIELKTLDDRYESDLAAANTKQLIEQDNVFALFGYVGTPTSNAALPIFTKAKVPFFAPFTGAMSLREPFNRYIFNIRASYQEETARIIEQLTSTGTTRIAVFYQNDAYGKAGLDGTEKALGSRGLKTIALGTVERNSVDVRKAVEALVAAQPDAVMMVSAYSSVAAFVKEMRKAGYTGQFHNVSFVGSKALADALGNESVGMAISQVMPFPFSPTAAIVREYQKLMSEAGHTDYNWSSLEGFVAARVFVEGLRRAGRDLTRDKLISGLESIGRFDVGGMDITFSPTNHNGSKFVELTIINSRGRFSR
ncbi:MAG TPA: ABC transporter substrate-binding protein [Burkholderiaceae bacterium]|nr:ABC transporter substrate-binding protein [Burkholderiaceae bacterium]